MYANDFFILILNKYLIIVCKQVLKHQILKYTFEIQYFFLPKKGQYLQRWVVDIALALINFH